MLVSRVIYGASTRVMAAKAMAPKVLFSVVGSSNTNQVFNNGSGPSGTLSHHQIHNLPTYLRSSPKDATISKQECEKDVKNVVSEPTMKRKEEDEGILILLQREILSNISQVKKRQHNLLIKQEEMGIMLTEIHQGQEVGTLNADDQATKMKEMEETIKKVMADQTKMGTMLSETIERQHEMEESIKKFMAESKRRLFRLKNYGIY